MLDSLVDIVYNAINDGYAANFYDDNLPGGNTMKSTGIVRKLDELGRIVLPIELRRTLNLAEKDAVEIYVEGENIILRKYEPNCAFCGEAKHLVEYRGRQVCQRCARAIAERL